MLSFIDSTWISAKATKKQLIMSSNGGSVDRIQLVQIAGCAPGHAQSV